MSSVTFAEKTYSGEQAYHEMLVRAQARSPALLYILCKLFLGETVETKRQRVETRRIGHHDEEPLAYYFNDGSQDPLKYPSFMAEFVKEIFCGYTVRYSWDNGSASYTYGACYLYADPQFVRWLRSGVVEIDDELELATIKM